MSRSTVDEFLMPLLSSLRRLGNKVYDRAFPIYRPCYRAFKACTESAERRLLKGILSAGDVVVDAGANIGIYSQFLSRCVGPTGVVHAFEPSPENFKHLQSAVRKLANVRLSQAALGERSGRSTLYLSDKLNVDHRTYATDGDSRQVAQIDMIALDDYFKPGEPVALIKMDIQGYELHALRGADRVIRSNPDIKLLIEFWPYGLGRARAHWADLIAALQEKGMIIRQISAAGVIPFESSSAASMVESADWYINLFASRS